MTEAHTIGIPEIGQMAIVRRRRWVVTEVMGSDHYAQHLVSLASLEEDDSGEEMQVIWELELGAKVMARSGLPECKGIDAPDRLEAFLDAIRWGAVTSTDRSRMQSPFRSGIEIEDYQLEPLVRALDMAHVNLLIADDVGLGKTIEAGLVIQELILRHRARTVLIVVPASLQIKWKNEMQEKFGLEFRIVDTTYLKNLRRKRGIHVNPWTSYPRLITSMDWAKSREGFRFFSDGLLPPVPTYPKPFDILVVDEAHNVAPASSENYSIDSQRTALIRKLAPHFAHHLFLTATPHNGYTNSFNALLELLDNQRFTRSLQEPDPAQVNKIMIRRLKSDIVDSQGNAVFPKRVLQKLDIHYTEEERQIHQALKEFTQLRSDSSSNRFSMGVMFVNILLKKRLFSSPAAFHITLSKLSDSFQENSTKSDTERFKRQFAMAVSRCSDDDIVIQDNADNFVDDEEAIEQNLHDAAILANAQEAPLEKQLQSILDKLKKWANRNQNAEDSKAKAILTWIDTHLRPQGEWNDERVILFTEYRATLNWLVTIFANHKIRQNDRLMVLHGGTPSDDREKIKAAFQASPDLSPVRILLATDAAAEGIDLQNFCHYLIHIEVPWNPNVMEQRNGRIDRHGQLVSQVEIWHPVGVTENKSLNPKSSDDDGEYLWRAVEKVNRIRLDLGSVGNVIEKNIESFMLGLYQERSTANAEKRAEATRKRLESDKKVKERIAKCHHELLTTQQSLNLTPERIRHAVRVALDLAGQPALQPITLKREGAQITAWKVPEMRGALAERASVGLVHPHTGARRPVTFDHEIARNHDDVVLLHLNHPLVKWALQLLREEMWALEDRKHLNRVTLHGVPDTILKDPAIIVYSRLVITGGDNQRLHEEIITSGLTIGERPKRIEQVSQIEKMLNSSMVVDNAEEQTVWDICKLRYEKYQDNIFNSVDARAKERVESLHKAIHDRKEKEIKDIHAILDDLENRLRAELQEETTKGPQLFLPGFSPQELDQYKKDKEAVKARLARIPEEREKEIQNIERHFSSPSPRVFPIAVSFMIPASMI